MGQIDFYAWCRGYAPSGEFSDSGSRRFRDFNLSGGSVQTDQLEFLVSANILQWTSGACGYPKSDTYEKYRPRMMIGIYDSNAPNGLDYNPIIGFEFNLDYYNSFDYSSGFYGNDNFTSKYVSKDNYIGQTFKSTIPFTLKKVAFLAYNWWDDPKELTCEVKATNAYGKPTGDILSSGSTTDISPAVILFVLNKPVFIPKDTLYAIYMYVSSGSTPYSKGILMGDSSAGYSNGTGIVSTDQGEHWEICDGSPYPVFDFTFWLYGTRHQVVRPFIAKDITSSSPTNPEYRHGSWYTSGSNSYKIRLDGNNIKFYIDNNLKETWDISDITLDGGYKFGKGYTYNWDKFRIQLIDTASSGTTYTDTSYYDGKMTGGWEYNPNNMVDGSTTTYARETRGGSYYEYLNSNTFSISDNISIVKVEVRVHGRTVHLLPNDWAYIYLQPAFYRGGDLKWGSSHLTDVPDYCPTQGSMDWSSWIDITNDNNAPSEWTKEEVENLIIAVIGKNSSFLSEIYCDVSKVELRVTYMKYGDVSDYGNISGNIDWYSVQPITNLLAISDDNGQNWTTYSDKMLNQVVGWNYDYITKKKFAPDSNLNKYGKHLYTINEPLITSKEDAEALAQQYLNTYKSGLKVGSVVINGRTGIDLQSKFKLSGTYIDFNEELNISSYIQKIDKNGFTTTINYGTEPFDIAKKVANLENEVYG